ncbi:MAG: M28 family peptidase [Clostridiales Family XIII bacterium]|jgi:hypothetical protein|nr:M28 family peptidase [Clostridiales Family XIII bacterium]
MKRILAQSTVVRRLPASGRPLAGRLPGKAPAVALAVAALTALLPLSACKPQADAAPPDLGESIVVSAFSQEYQDFETALDIAFAKELMERLSYLGDDPATGFRTAGSPAETEAAALVESAMRRAGLQNVTREQAPVDGWVFKGASVLFENRKGKQERIALGGYPINLVAAGQALTLVDAGKGRASDYAGLDVRGKLVLLYADGEDAPWGAGFRAVQAKLFGAKAVLFCAEADASQSDKLLSSGFGAPSDAPAFAIDKAGYDLLRAALKRAENGELPVILNADSVVAGGAPTVNLWGEIPGRSAEVIYMLSNYDGFYRSAFEGAAGVSAMLGIAKGLCDSGFLPNKTIRFVACGAGEWGAVNTPFDRGAGAWRQLSQLHPEWAEQAFAVLNVDALYPTKNKLNLGMTATDEIYAFAERSASQLVGTAMYGFARHSSANPSEIVTEDIIWNLFGIPAVAARPGDGDKFYRAYRRSNKDTVEAAGFDDGAYRFGQLLFGKLILDLDEVIVRPVNIETPLRAVLASLAAGSVTNARLTDALSAAAEAAATLAADIEAMNLKYLGSGEAARAVMEDAAIGLNRDLYALNRMLRDAFARFDRRGALLLPHEETSANTAALRETLRLLDSRDAPGALSALKTVGFGRYADYDVRVCDAFAAQDSAGTWGVGRETGPVCRADVPARSLALKIEEENPDLSAETEAIDALLAQEELRLREILEEELSRIEEIAPRIDNAIADLAPHVDPQPDS